MDAKGRESLCGLLALMQQSPWPSHKDIPLCQPEVVAPWIVRVGKTNSPRTLTLAFKSAGTEQISIQEGRAKLFVDELFTHAIVHNYFDQSIYKGNSVLWFW